MCSCSLCIAPIILSLITLAYITNNIKKIVTHYVVEERIRHMQKPRSLPLFLLTLMLLIGGYAYNNIYRQTVETLSTARPSSLLVSSSSNINAPSFEPLIYGNLILKFMCQAMPSLYYQCLLIASYESFVLQMGGWMKILITPILN